MSVYDCLGDHEKAIELKKHHPLWEKVGVSDLIDSVFHEVGWLAVIEEEIKIIEEHVVKSGFDLSMQFLRYLDVGKPELALDCAEKMYELGDPNLPYIFANPTYNVLKDDPRYIALLKKMNLPMD